METEKEYLTLSTEYKDCLETDLTSAELITKEIYRELTPRWNWWAPIIIILVWWVPLAFLSIFAIILGFTPLVFLFIIVGAIPYIFLKKGRKIYFMLYHKFIWNNNDTSVRQVLWKKFTHIMIVQPKGLWKSFQEKKKDIKEKKAARKQEKLLKKQQKVWKKTQDNPVDMVPEPLPPPPPESMKARESLMGKQFPEMPKPIPETKEDVDALLLSLEEDLKRLERDSDGNV